MHPSSVCLYQRAGRSEDNSLQIILLPQNSKKARNLILGYYDVLGRNNKRNLLCDIDEISFVLASTLISRALG